MTPVLRRKLAFGWVALTAVMGASLAPALLPEIALNLFGWVMVSWWAAVTGFTSYTIFMVPSQSAIEGRDRKALR